MKKLQLLPVGSIDALLLEWLGQALCEKFRVPAEILWPGLDPAFALHAERQQYHSSEILASMQRYINGSTWRLLGITQFDLYIPILTFVFGEAQLGGTSAVVSYHRLQQEFYGLPQDPDLLANRLLVEAVHELGHTLSLTHCHDYQCAMAPSHAVEWIDIKDSGFCEDCLGRALLAV
ncbi:MAG TPA: archaemetzincin family Zn-dependent metalloprotease [Candidatus Binatia bacterium]|nr:archaemetzincin family Zn-dependent metalloprotease [Candidatus Binatia bacterium]